MVAQAAHDDGGSLLALALIGEGERYEDDVAEVIGGRTRHRPRYPISKAPFRLTWTSKGKEARARWARPGLTDLAVTSVDGR